MLITDDIDVIVLSAEEGPLYTFTSVDEAVEYLEENSGFIAGLALPPVKGYSVDGAQYALDEAAGL